MATSKYGWDTPTTGVTGWNSILTAALDSIDTLLATCIKLYAGESISQYETVHIGRDGKWYKAVADGLHPPCVGFAYEDGTADVYTLVQRAGVITNSSWSLVPGYGVWLHTSTRGEITQTKPGSNDQLLGIATASDSVLINIHLDTGSILPQTSTTTTTSSTTTTTSP